MDPYKYVIGQIFLLQPNVRTVVNKTTAIDNTYRNFSMETIGGCEDYAVSVRENGVKFEFDFSKVYWNPRLSTEHGKIVDLLKVNKI